MYQQAVVLPNSRTLHIRVTPKCGKTTVESIICYPYKGQHEITPSAVRDLRRMGKLVNISDCEPDYRIAVVRDPVARLCSAYQDRIVIKNRERLRSHIQSWQQFLDRLEHLQHSSRDIRIHTQPQTRRLGTDASVYDRVFTTDQLSREFLEYIHEITGTCVPPVRANQTRQPFADSVSDQDRQRIRELYEVDYRYWGSYFDVS